MGVVGEEHVLPEHSEQKLPAELELLELDGESPAVVAAVVIMLCGR